MEYLEPMLHRCSWTMLDEFFEIDGCCTSLLLVVLLWVDEVSTTMAKTTMTTTSTTAAGYSWPPNRYTLDVDDEGWTTRQPTSTFVGWLESGRVSWQCVSFVGFRLALSPTRKRERDARERELFVYLCECVIATQQKLDVYFCIGTEKKKWW